MVNGRWRILFTELRKCSKKHLCFQKVSTSHKGIDLQDSFGHDLASCLRCQSFKVWFSSPIPSDHFQHSSDSAAENNLTLFNQSILFQTESMEEKGHFCGSNSIRNRFPNQIIKPSRRFGPCLHRWVCTFDSRRYWNGTRIAY